MVNDREPDQFTRQIKEAVHIQKCKMERHCIDLVIAVWLFGALVTARFNHHNHSAGIHHFLLWSSKFCHVWKEDATAVCT